MSTEKRRTRLGATPWILASAALLTLFLIGLPSRRSERLPARDEDVALADGDGRHAEYAYFFRDPALECRIFEICFLDRDPDQEVDRERLRRRIAELGPSAIQVVFGVLTGEFQLDPDRPPPELTLGAYQLPQDLPGLEDLLVESLWEFDPAATVGHVDNVTPQDATIALRLASTRVLAGVRDPAAFETLLRIFVETDPIQFRRPHVRAEFAEALRRRLSEDPHGFDAARDALSELDPAALPILVDAVPVQASGAGWSLLFDLLEQDAALDALVVRRICDLAGGLHDDALEHTLWRVHWLIDNPAWEIRRDSAVALGKLRDPDSCPMLIQMLGDEDRRVANAALWALRELSGRTFEAQPGLWTNWYEEQRAWFEGPAAQLERDLGSERRAEVIRAVALLSQRPLFRHHAAAVLGPLLWHPDPEVVRAVCAALGQLDSRRAVVALVGRLDGSGAEEVALARAALGHLTGLELPPEHDLWVAALGL